MDAQDLSCFLLQLAGEGGAETATTLTTRLVEHDMQKIRDLVGLQLHDLESSQGGVDPIFWDEEARLHRPIIECMCVIILKIWQVLALARKAIEKATKRGRVCPGKSIMSETGSPEKKLRQAYGT